MARGVFVSRAESERATLKELIDRYVLEITLQHCSGQIISDSLIDFFDVDSRSKALGDILPSFECSLMLL